MAMGREFPYLRSNVGREFAIGPGMGPGIILILKKGSVAGAWQRPACPFSDFQLEC